MDIWDGRSKRGRRDFVEVVVPSLNPMDPRRTNVEAFELIMGIFAGIPAPGPGAKMSAPREIREKAIKVFQSTARALTDQWIDSGRQDGIEQPWARNVQFTTPSYPESIASILTRHWKRNPPTLLFNGNDPVLLAQSSPRHSDWADLTEQPLEGILTQARDYATAQFALLMDSPSRYRIFRCEECGTYFTKERMPKKGVVIKRGSYCEQCAGAASERRVRETRERRIAEMIGWAADALAQWQFGNRCGEKVHWIVKKINVRLEAKGREAIRSNWVSRHLSAIETEVERRSHAKS